MSIHNAIRGIAVAACVAIGMLLSTASGAFAAASVHLCVGEEAGSPVRSGGATGSCKANETPVALPSSEADQQTLLSIASHAKYIESGVGGKPTIQFSGVNVQVVNGSGATATKNGEGNLVIGYDERRSNPPQEQSGSHNLILGEEQTFNSFGSMIGGSGNTSTGPFTAVFGSTNIASGLFASVSGGYEDRATGEYSSVSGGWHNKATGDVAWVGGGRSNTAEGKALTSSVSGGFFNIARGEGPEAVIGGAPSVSGGAYNEAVSYGGEIIAPWVGGGEKNKAEGGYSSISGGAKNLASGGLSSVSGGESNKATGLAAWVGGGKLNLAAPAFSSIYGGKETPECTTEYCAKP